MCFRFQSQSRERFVLLSVVALNINHVHVKLCRVQSHINNPTETRKRVENPLSDFGLLDLAGVEKKRALLITEQQVATKLK